MNYRPKVLATYGRIIICVCVLLIVGTFTVLQKRNVVLRVHDNTYSLILADTEAARTQGLSGRKSLDSNTCMLFVFQSPDTYGIWMKDMQFSLDILWVNQDKNIVYQKQAVLPRTYPTVFRPSQPAQYVLECNAGFIEDEKLSIGDHLDF